MSQWRAYWNVKEDAEEPSFAWNEPRFPRFLARFRSSMALFSRLQAVDADLEAPLPAPESPPSSSALSTLS